MLAELKLQLQDAFVLDHYVAIYVPSTIHGDTKAPTSLIRKVKLHVQTELAKLFGGDTTYKSCEGGWPDENDGHLILENVQIVKANCTKEDLIAKFGAVKELAQYVKCEMSQQAVSVEIDGELAIL